MGYIWLCILCLLLLLILLFPLTMRVEFGYSKNAGKQRLTVFINGIAVYKNEFDKKAKAKKTTEPKKERENGDGGFAVFMKKLRFYDALYTELKPDIARLLVYFRKKLRIPKYVMHLDLGFPDAANTGVASGAAYALVYGLAALIYNHLNLNMKDLDVYVTPHFHDAKIDFYFNGIFRLRLVHIIRALFMLLCIYGKFKKFKNKTNEGGVLV